MSGGTTTCDTCKAKRKGVPREVWLIRMPDYGWPAARGVKWVCWYCKNTVGLGSVMKNEAIMHTNHMLNLTMPADSEGRRP